MGNKAESPVVLEDAVKGPGKLSRMFLTLYDVFQFIGRFFKEGFLPPYEGKELMKQCYDIGYRSLALISLTGFITGVVFTKQSRPSLAEFGATSWLPSLVGIALLRTLAPLLTSLIAAGKVGSSIGAELGSMRVTEQIDAMEVSATNPFKFLVTTRVLAATITIPILTFYTAMVGMLGALLNVSMSEGTSAKAFFQSSLESITFLDITASTVKAVIFGFTIGMVGCYQGYNSSKGTEGVGKAANSAVVIGMFLIFIEEVVSVQFFGLFRT
ncbi:MlaE family ABC transporter permease [Pedobacter metabolipauper]|uniref:Phospholipid/cholesterol/gamma-HCH transport system permease protein n=1 Tax=Pedobacter metabolipauper TaxID=425513 RepID=A0A4R6T1C2_9SPHI|nr:ABC transporter permease [Pedobacter metabolipauper]TDQ11141.1 phospholipid/cholesterol/gamma-HCH transport system permease protein [Pedobacter metabolipauper]